MLNFVAKYTYTYCWSYNKVDLKTENYIYLTTQY